MILLLLILFFPSLSYAACHVYIVPNQTIGTKNVPKYIYDVKGVLTSGVTNFSGMRYGSHQVWLIGTDVSDALDKQASALPDVTKLPDNLSATLGANLKTVQTKLEAANIPADLLTAGTTYRQMLRGVSGALLFMQRFQGLSGIYTPVFSGSVTLATTFNQLSTNVQNWILYTAQSFGMSTAGYSGASTLRDILNGIGKQSLGTPIPLGCVTI